MNMKFLALLAAATVSQALAQTSVDPYMGDWKGTLKIGDGTEQDVVAAMIPLSGGKYEVKFFSTFEQRVPVLQHLKASFQAGDFKALDAISFDPWRVVGTTENGVVFGASFWAGQLQQGTLQGTVAGKSKGQFKLTQSKRTSPTLGAKPPAGAIVLFDGQSLEGWQTRDRTAAKAKLIDGGVFQIGGGDMMTKETFGDQKLHLEFLLPYMPTSFGQGRANSGVYLQSRYEVQVLDSYGLESQDNDCGGIYQIARPIVNGCFPPLQWQAYDITFHAARFDDSGKKTANSRITVVQNGVTIQDNLELPHITPGGQDNNEKNPGPLMLQDHGNPVQYRNIWVQKLN